MFFFTSRNANANAIASAGFCPRIKYAMRSAERRPTPGSFSNSRISRSKLSAGWAVIVEGCLDIENSRKSKVEEVEEVECRKRYFKSQRQSIGAFDFRLFRLSTISTS